MLQADWLFLYGQTAVFVYIFMEIVVSLKPFKRVIYKQATQLDKIILMLLFGSFSIFGTYIGIPMPSGAIMSIRDLGPMVAGLSLGPVFGLGAGLIGGVHRFSLGGFVAVPCGLATIFAGLACGVFHVLKSDKLISRLQGMVIVAILECLHMGLVLLIARPFDEAMATVKAVMLPMILANSMGMFFSIMIIGRDLTAREGI